MEWTLFVGAGALVLALGSFYLASSSRLLSIREYESFSIFVRRELDGIEDRLTNLEQTRPTTGEIEARFNGIKFKDKCIPGKTGT